MFVAASIFWIPTLYVVREVCGAECLAPELGELGAGIGGYIG